MKLLHHFLIAFAVASLVVMLAVAAFYGVENWRGAREWENTRREMAAQGEPPYFAALVPAPVPDEQNLAMIPLFAQALNYRADPATQRKTLSPEPVGPFWRDMPAGPTAGHSATSAETWLAGRTLVLADWQKLYAASKEYPHPPRPGRPSADVLLALTRYDDVLNELERAADERPLTRFPVDWEQDSLGDIRVPHGLLVCRLAETLRLRACAELVEGQHDRAARNILTALRLARGLGREPHLLCCVQDLVATLFALQPVWEGLASHRWSADELRRFQVALRQDDHLENCLRTMRGEREAFCSRLDHLQTELPQWKSLFVAENDPPYAWGRIGFRLFAWMPGGWLKQNKAFACRSYQQGIIRSIDLRAHRVSPVMARTEDEVLERTAKFSPHTFLARIALITVSPTLGRCTRTQTACEEAEVACALERYFLEHRRYPDGLDALVPAYLDRVLHDLTDGAPMRYRRTGDGRYLLYGVGWNGRDDGGTMAWQQPSPGKFPARPDDKEGDWVWQYTPANPPEGTP